MLDSLSKKIKEEKKQAVEEIANKAVAQINNGNNAGSAATTTEQHKQQCQKFKTDASTFQDFMRIKVDATTSSSFDGTIAKFRNDVRDFCASTDKIEGTLNAADNSKLQKNSADINIQKDKIMATLYPDFKPTKGVDDFNKGCYQMQQDVEAREKKISEIPADKLPPSLKSDSRLVRTGFAEICMINKYQNDQYITYFHLFYNRLDVLDNRISSILGQDKFDIKVYEVIKPLIESSEVETQKIN